jgi:hypothetical protein
MNHRQMAATIVALVEKVLGTGFDPLTDDAMVGHITHFLQDTVPSAPTSHPAPDAHLEMAYEDRVSGWMD